MRPVQFFVLNPPTGDSRKKLSSDVNVAALAKRHFNDTTRLLGGCMNNIDHLEPIIDAKTAAQVLQCSPRAIQRLCESGALTSCRIGRRYRINTASLLRYAGYGPEQRDGER